jgi:hypothetical protein
MSMRASRPPGPALDRRLEALRGGAPLRSPTVRVLAVYAQHTDCPLATLGFAAGVDFDHLLDGTRYQAPFGQSPFAITRGVSFERLLRDRNYAATLDLLRTGLGFPVADARIADLRDGYPRDSRGMVLRQADTNGQLRRIVRGAADAPNLIDGAVLAADVGGARAFFEADALAFRSDGEVRVAEVKSFPKVDERVDPDKLGAALDQVAFYILLARQEVGRLGGDPERLVSDHALLVTPRNVGMAPALSQQRVGQRVRRAARVLAGVPRVEDVAASVPAGLSFGPVAAGAEERRVAALHVLADRVGTSYTPACLSTCGNAKFCRERAFRDGSPCLAGPTAQRLLPGVATLGRAEELTRGAPAAAGEADAAALLGRAGRLYDEAVGTTGAPRRRLA